MLLLEQKCIKYYKCESIDGCLSVQLIGFSISFYTKLNTWYILLAVKFYKEKWVPRLDTKGAYPILYIKFDSQVKHIKY